MLTLVPARGGSKRIARKNAKVLGGFPLIMWTLGPFHALDPVVSSDDEEILAIAKWYRFRTLKRPDELATDAASSADVAIHAMRELGETSVMLLQPTSPFRSGETVDAAVKLHAEGGRPVVAMKSLHHAYLNGMPVDQPFKAPTGSCYIIGMDDLIARKTFLPPGFLSVSDTSLGALDIDYGDEWDHAEAIARTKTPELAKILASRMANDLAAKG